MRPEIGRDDGREASAMAGFFGSQDLIHRNKVPNPMDMRLSSPFKVKNDPS